MKKHAVAGLALMMICQFALAGGPDKAMIPDTASWVAHIDVEGVLASKTFKTLSGMIPLLAPQAQTAPAGKKDPAEQFDQFINDIKKISSVTLYGVAGSEAQPVAIVRGKLDKKAIMAMVGIAEDKPSEMYGNRKIYLAGNKDKPSESCNICFYDDNTIIGCQNVAQLRSAMDLADGSGKALSADNVLTEMLTINKDTVAIIAARDIDGYARLIKKESPVGAAVLSKVKHASLKFGENETAISISASITAISPEHAENIEQVFKGLIAMGELTSGGDKNLDLIRKLIKPTISRDGAKVGAEIKTSLEEILIAIVSGQFEKGMSGPGHRPGGRGHSRPATQPANAPAGKTE